MLGVLTVFLETLVVARALAGVVGVDFQAVAVAVLVLGGLPALVGEHLELEITVQMALRFPVAQVGRLVVLRLVEIMQTLVVAVAVAVALLFITKANHEKSSYFSY
jgi:hypothetical protein